MTSILRASKRAGLLPQDAAGCQRLARANGPEPSEEGLRRGTAARLD
jgi:hypothetical protein